MARLGQLYSAEGEHDKAVAAFEEALVACDESDVVAVHPLRAFILSRYGACTNDLALAEKYLLQAQAMYRELKWEDESAFANIESHLGQVRMPGLLCARPIKPVTRGSGVGVSTQVALFKGDLEKAESLISEALRKQTELLGRVHPEYVALQPCWPSLAPDVGGQCGATSRGTTLSWLARVRFERGDLIGQEEALRECMVSCGGIVDAECVSGSVCVCVCVCVFAPSGNGRCLGP